MSFSRRSMLQLTATAAVIALGAATSSAMIVAVVPDVVLFQPADVRLNATQSDTQINGFDEKQCFSLTANLPTDQGMIPAGTEISCHYFHFDPVNMNVILAGKARFDDLILGVISSSGGLDLTDAACKELDANGNPVVIYPAAGVEVLRGLESTQVDDQYQVIQGGFAIRMRMNVQDASDSIRVITRCCPPGEPECD